MSIVKDVNVNGRTVFDTNNLLVYLTDHLKTGGGKYVAGLGFITDNFLDEIQAVKIANQKTGGRQFRQITIAPSPAGKKLSNETYLNIGVEIGEYYYDLGYQIIIVYHTDTDTPHMHLMPNSVNFRTGKMFSQSKGELNRFKVHCNHIFAKYGLDMIGKPVEAMMDNVIHDLSEGFDCLELFDEIMADKAISLSDLYKDPVSQDTHIPSYNYEYTSSNGYNVYSPADSKRYFNPDAPKPWDRIAIYPDGSWGIPSRPINDMDSWLMKFMAPEDRQKILTFFPHHQYYRRQEISGKQFTNNPNLFLNNRFEINVLVDSEAEHDMVIAVLNKLRHIAEAERAYNTKLGVASVAQLDHLGVAANVTPDNSTTLNVTIKGNDGTEQTVHEVIDIPDKDKE